MQNTQSDFLPESFTGLLENDVNANITALDMPSAPDGYYSVSQFPNGPGSFMSDTQMDPSILRMPCGGEMGAAQLTLNHQNPAMDSQMENSHEDLDTLLDLPAIPDLPWSDNFLFDDNSGSAPATQIEGREENPEGPSEGQSAPSSPPYESSGPSQPVPKRSLPKDDEDAKAHERRIKNRYSAKKTREKKRDELAAMTAKMARMEQKLRRHEFFHKSIHSVCDAYGGSCPGNCQLSQCIKQLFARQGIKNLQHLVRELENNQ
uniref:BZIP domain-containing protein n=1 Tax=Coccidioides posadasii RMSCC 3488 TaxID=454284 RepID=A0A0J6FRZ6_COCPO|nr:hypothetical protein CPAG_08145 [Coccidioides posadasii RMSCC 3488]